MVIPDALKEINVIIMRAKLDIYVFDVVVFFFTVPIIYIKFGIRLYDDISR